MSDKPVILCVDDEKMVLDSLRYQLANQLESQFDFEFAESGDEALEIVEELLDDELKIPLVISDQIMPGMKGDELLVKIAELTEVTKRILLTGQANADDVGNAVNNADLYRYIAKPWDPTDLILTIKEAAKSYEQKLEIELKNKRLAQLVGELEEANEGLNKKVEERTVEILQQKEVIENKNKSIISSINYAQRLQQALLTDRIHFKRAFEDYFVYFKPRDIVSGDFYWLAQVGTKTVVTAADCSGHGVPGAIMSILGMKAFVEICKHQNVSDPAEILNSLHEYIRETFSQEQADSMQDGMDLSICTIDGDKKKMSFAAARNPLVIVRGSGENEEDITVVKGDRLSVGGFQHETKREFTKHEIEIEEGAQYYMFSDGFQDQFGGPNNKKFSPRNMRTLLAQNYSKSFSEQEENLNVAFEEWKADTQQIDDILVLGFKVK